MLSRLSAPTIYDEYSIKHLGYHLHKAGMNDELYRLVIKKDWYLRSINFAPSGRFYLEDTRLAFLAAVEQVESLNRSGNLPGLGKYLPRPAALALISAGLGYAMDNIPPSVLEALIRLGSPGQAVQLVERIHDPVARGKALVHVGQTMYETGEYTQADSLREQARELLLSSAADFFHEKYEVLSQLVCTYVRAGQLEEASLLADKLQKEAESKWEMNSITCKALACAWEAVGDIEQASTAARTFKGKEYQITALCNAAGNMLSIDRTRALELLDEALGLFPETKDREALSKLSQVLAEAGRVKDAWRVAGENIDAEQRSRILIAAARGARQSNNPETARKWLAEAFKALLTVEPGEKQLLLLVELARIGQPLDHGNNGDRLIALVKDLWQKAGIENHAGEHEKGAVALGLLALGDTQGAGKIVSNILDWQPPKDDLEEDDALGELAGILGQSGDMAGLDWLLSRIRQKQSSSQQAILAYYLAKAYAAAGALSRAGEAEQLMLTAALEETNSPTNILPAWREENREHPGVQKTAQELLHQYLSQSVESGDLPAPDASVLIALTMAKEKKFTLARFAIQQTVEAIKRESDENTTARVIGLVAEAAVLMNDGELLDSLEAAAGAIEDEYLNAEALCWIAGWQAVMGRYEEARRIYFQVNNHDHETWEPVSPADIEAALEKGNMDWVAKIALDIGWPTTKSAAIFAGLGIALERPGPRWIEDSLHAIDNIMERYNSVRTICHRVITARIAADPHPSKTALEYWLSALEHNRKRDSGETWAVIAASLPLFYKQFGRSFTGSLWMELAKVRQMFS